MDTEVTVHSDGTGRGTVLMTGAGEPVKHVASADIHVESDGLVEVSIELRPASLNMVGKFSVVTFFCPKCNLSHDHQCAGPPDMVTGLTLDFEICGVSDGTNLCYINRELDHNWHWDVSTGVGWSNE